MFYVAVAAARRPRRPGSPTPRPGTHPTDTTADCPPAHPVRGEAADETGSPSCDRSASPAAATPASRPADPEHCTQRLCGL